MTPQQLHDRRKLKARRKQIQRKLRRELVNPSAESRHVLALDEALTQLDKDLEQTEWLIERRRLLHEAEPPRWWRK